MSHFGHLAFAVRSEVGLKRPNNEDSYGSFPSYGVWCVADGMGGGDDGEIASAATVQELERLFSANPMPKGGAFTGADVADAVVDAVNSASEWIFQRAKERKRRGCGSTFVGVVFDATCPKEALALHAGDSRLYRIRDRTIRQITKDHSAAELVGVKCEADLNPMFRGMVLRAVGVQPDVSVQRTPFHVKKGDVVLLCSDGLSRMVPDKLIAEIVYLERGNPVRMVDRLIEAAYEAGAVDNVTVEVVCVGELPQPAIPVAFMSDGGLSDARRGQPETEETDGRDEEGATTQDTSSAASTRSVAETREDDRKFCSGEPLKASPARRWRLVAYVSSIVAICLLACLAVMAFMWRQGRQNPEPMPVGPSERQTEVVREVAPPPAVAPRPTSTVTNELNETPLVENVRPPVPVPPVSGVTSNSTVSIPETKGADAMEREALSVELKAAREVSLKAESDAAKDEEWTHGMAVELQKACRSPSFAKFMQRLETTFGSSQCASMRERGKTLAEMKPDENGLDAVAGDFVRQLQKFKSTTNGVARAIMPARKMAELSRKEPMSGWAYWLAAEIIRTGASEKEGDGGSQR